MISPSGFRYDNSVHLMNGNQNHISAALPIDKITGIRPIDINDNKMIDKTENTVCQTCKNRKYIDRSNDSNVSFQTPTHISPESSFARVASHEQEHVANAVSEGSKEGNQLVRASVRLKTEICPECGKPYIAGGITTTQIKYNVSNPYESARKSIEGSLLKGMNVNDVA